MHETDELTSLSTANLKPPAGFNNKYQFAAMTTQAGAIHGFFLVATFVPEASCINTLLEGSENKPPGLTLFVLKVGLRQEAKQR